ncbi:MAG: transcription antitermination factor NusB [Actinomycetota bacterium]
MAKRRRARKIVLDVLYRMEIERGQVEDMLEAYRDEMEEKGIADFVAKLFKGVMEHRREIDKLIDQYADRWSIERMPVLDRNILRIGTYEILYEEDIPYGVSINEAVELANTYSTEESGKFVNGILGRLVKEIESKAESAKPKTG